MRRMAADGVKVQSIVTSPPYWGLRDYGHSKALAWSTNLGRGGGDGRARPGPVGQFLVVGGAAKPRGQVALVGGVQTNGLGFQSLGLKLLR